MLVKNLVYYKKCLQKVGNFVILLSIMKRLIYKNLIQWKQSKSRMPLILNGARQVGKSYILTTFGKNEFTNVFHFNFEKDKALIDIFEPNLFPKRIVQDLSFHIGEKIDLHNDLVIFDEIQECPKAITSLKYFCEDMPELAVCSAGSLLGVKLSVDSFPVGKVDVVSTYLLPF